MMCMCWVCACECACSQRQEVSELPRAVATGGYELPDGSAEWEWNLGPLKEKHLLFTAGPSL